MDIQNVKVFYSWQSDLPNSTNRSFIEKALTEAAKSIREDDSIKVEPVIDRDTLDVPGAPDIATTIFSKIDNAKVFVCDVSIIGVTGNRATSNPNVLLELGYAVRALGWRNIIMVRNTKYGGPELLPFDLRMRRAISYGIEETATEKAEVRRQLPSKLAAALRLIFEDRSEPEPGELIKPERQGSIVDLSLEVTKADDVVFQILGRTALQKGKGIVYEEELLDLTKAEGLTNDEVLESLHLLESSLFIEIRNVLNTSKLFHSVRFTDLGLEEYAKLYVEDYAALGTSVAMALTISKLVDSKLIAEKLSRPILLINHIIKRFEDRGWLKTIKSNTGDYNFHAYQISPVLNRVAAK